MDFKKDKPCNLKKILAYIIIIISVIIIPLFLHHHIIKTGLGYSADTGNEADDYLSYITTACSILTAIIVALIGTAVTAYVFFISTIDLRRENRKYENHIIDELKKSKVTKLKYICIIGIVIIVFSWLESMNSLGFLSIPFIGEILFKLKDLLGFDSENASLFILLIISMAFAAFAAKFIYEITVFDKSIECEAIKKLQNNKFSYIHNESKASRDRSYSKFINDMANIERLINKFLLNFSSHATNFAEGKKLEIILSEIYEHNKDKQDVMNPKEFVSVFNELIIKRNTLMIVLNSEYEKKECIDIDYSPLCEKTKELISVLNNVYIKNNMFKDTEINRYNFDEGNIYGATFDDSSFYDVCFVGTKMNNSEMRRCRFNNCNFSKVNAEKSFFTGASFTNIKVDKNKNAVFNSCLFDDADLSFWNEDGAIENCDFNDASFSGANLSNCNLNNVEINRANFEKANLTSSKISAPAEKAIFINTIMFNTKIEGTSKELLNFMYTNFTSAKMTNCSLINVSFEKSRMEENVLLEAKSQKCCFDRIYGRLLNFKGAEITNSSFKYSVMEQVDFSLAEIDSCSFDSCLCLNSVMMESYFSCVDFKNADFSKSQIDSVIFIGCTFEETVLTDAMVRNCIFYDCEFKNCLFDDSSFINCWFISSKGLINEMFEKSNYIFNTTDIEFVIKNNNKSLRFNKNDPDVFKFTDCNCINDNSPCEASFGVKTSSLSVRDAIFNRYSCRSFDTEKTVSKEIINKIVEAGTRAPSAKNRQPWFYTVVYGKTKIVEVSDILSDSIDKLRELRISQDKSIDDLKMAEATVTTIRQASAIVFIGYERNPSVEHNDAVAWELAAPEFEVVDIQALGASVQNMLLLAEELGVASLWTCDILYSQEKLKKMFNMKYDFIAAVLFGYSSSHKTPRKSIDEKSVWIDD